MTRRKHGLAEQSRQRGKVDHANAACAPQTQAIPLTPRPKLLTGLSIVFALWVLAMLWMYLGTVR